MKIRFFCTAAAPSEEPSKYVEARLFRNDGVPRGEKIRVSATSRLRQVDPAVVTAGDSFVVVWQTYDRDSPLGINSIFARRFCYSAPTPPQTIAAIYDTAAAGGCGIDCQSDRALTAADLPCAVQRLARDSSSPG